MGIWGWVVVGCVAATRKFGIWFNDRKWRTLVSINEFTAIQRIKQSRVTRSKHQFYCILSEAADSSVVNVFIVNFLGGKFKQHLWTNVVDTFSKPSSFESKINRYEPIGIVEWKIQDCVCKQADFLLQFRLFFHRANRKWEKETKLKSFFNRVNRRWVCCFDSSLFFVTYNKRLGCCVLCVHNEWLPDLVTSGEKSIIHSAVK